MSEVFIKAEKTFDEPYNLKEGAKEYILSLYSHSSIAWPLAILEKRFEFEYKISIAWE